MAVIQINDFGGLAPIYDVRKLPGGLSTLAQSCRFEVGELVPLSSAVTASTYTVNVSALFKYKPFNSNTWLAWPSPWVVDVVTSPIPQDSLGRIYWTRYNPASSDNYPRAASQPTQSAIIKDSYPVKRLGVPKPTGTPTMRETFAASTAYPVTMSQTSPVRVTTAVDHPFKDGQRVVVKFATPPEDNSNMAEINGLEFIVIFVDSRTFDLRGSDGAEYSEFTAPAGVSIERVYEDADLVSRAYVVTFVSEWGEEGPPSDPSLVRDFRYDSSIEVKIASSIATDYSGINRMRFYRTESGIESTNFFFVGEVSFSGVPLSISFNDNKLEDEVGELLPSIEWVPPVNGLQGLVQMPNGFLAGFVGNTLYFSEAYMPHAWPDRFRRTTAMDIVGIAVYGQSLVVATKGKPYIAEGTDPGSISLRELDIDAPCLEKGSVCSVGSGVMYASPDGLMFVNAGGATNLTERLFGKIEWAAYVSSGMRAIFHDRRYIALSKDTAKVSWIAERAGDRLDISTSTYRATAPALDPDTDQLNLVLTSAGLGASRSVFESGSALTAVWQSKVFTLPKPVSLGCGQVFATGYPIQLIVSHAEPTTSTGQTPVALNGSFSVTVTGPDPFRLPSGFLSREWQFRVESAYSIQAMAFAEAMDELRQI